MGIIERVKDDPDVLILVTKMREVVRGLQEEDNGVEEKAIRTLHGLMLKWLGENPGGTTCWQLDTKF